jgi:hypothetical protein
MKRVGFKRKELPKRHVDPGRITRGLTYAGTTSGPAPKKPADRLPALLRLAEGEDCTGKMYGGYCRCRPDTVVWAHPNEQAENKGGQYKGNDSGGAFLGVECHDFVDGRSAPGAQQDERLAVFRAAQERTRARLREIACSKTTRPWKIAVARAALELLEATHGE